MVAVVAVVAAVVTVGSYLTWLAGRLDRLAVRVEAAGASLEAQLVRRAACARTVSALAPYRSGRPPSGPDQLLALRDAADAALAAGPEQREAAESALSRALRAALAVVDEEDAPVLAADSASTRVKLARQFHNDAVLALLTLRRRRLVRWLRLYGRARAPRYFDIDDATRGTVADSGFEVFGP